MIGQGTKLATLSCLALLGAGCNIFVDGEAVRFSSGKDESESMSGRAWRTPVFMEANTSSPENLLSVTHRGYELQAYENTAELSAVLYHSASGFFRGYYRTYKESTGWSQAGTGFRRVTSGNSHLGYPGIGVSKGNLRLMVFFNEGLGEFSLLSSHDGFTLESMLTSAGNAYPPYDFIQSADPYSRSIRVAYDLLNAAYISTLDFSTSQLAVHRWEPASGITDTETLGGGTALEAAHDAASDGKDRICFTYEGGSPVQFRGTCFNTSEPTAPAFYNIENESVYSGPVMGHATASDGNGTLLSVFYRQVSGVWSLYSVRHRHSTGKWDTSPQQVDTGMPVPDFQTAPDACDAVGACVDLYPKPALAYVGDGKFVAVWVSLNITSRIAGLFYATYSTLDGWGPVKLLGKLRSYYYVDMPFLSPTLHSTTSGDAVVGVRFVASEPSAAQRQYDVYKTLAARYHRDVGFKKVTPLGDGCTPGIGSEFAVCTHPVRVAQLTSGAAVVIYTDQDQNSRFRLESTEFK